MSSIDSKDLAQRTALNNLSKVLVLATDRGWSEEEVEPIREVMDQLTGWCRKDLQLVGRSAIISNMEVSNV